MITKSLIGLSALISAGFVVGTDPAYRPDAPAKFSDRFASFEALMLQPTELQRVPVLPASIAPTAALPADDLKSGRLAVSRSTGCERQTWPYIASDCLTSIDGSDVRAPARTITIERRFDNGSILVQAELAEMVNR